MTFNYTYTKPAGLLKDQLLTEVWAANLYPQTYEVNEDVIFGFVEELTVPEETTLAGVVTAYVADANWREKADPWGIPEPCNCRFFCLEISALNMGANELTVKRVINAETFTMVCHVSEELQHLNTATELAVGDFVYVIYEDNNPANPVAISKKA